MNQSNTRTPARLLMIGLAVVLIFVNQAGAVQETTPPAFTAALEKLPETVRQNQTLQTDLKALFMTYGNFIKGVESRAHNQVYLIMPDGQTIVYNDGRTKSI